MFYQLTGWSFCCLLDCACNLHGDRKPTQNFKATRRIFVSVKGCIPQAWRSVVKGQIAANKICTKVLEFSRMNFKRTSKFEVSYVQSWWINHDLPPKTKCMYDMHAWCLDHFSHVLFGAHLSFFRKTVQLSHSLIFKTLRDPDIISQGLSILDWQFAVSECKQPRYSQTLLV